MLEQRAAGVLLAMVTALLIGVSSLCYVAIGSTRNEQVAYKDYYISVETLLDSLGIDCDHPIFETEVGKTYLEKKQLVDE